MKQSLRAKRMARANRRLRETSKLNLVSLMDIFTILVFFLLVNSSDVEVLSVNKDIKLPDSVADKKPEENLIIMITDTDIVIGGRKIADVAAVEASATQNIEALSKELQYLASRKPYKSEEAEQRGRDITIMGDKDLPYTLLKKVMATCATTEYRNISFAVNQVAYGTPQEVSSAPVGG